MWVFTHPDVGNQDRASVGQVPDRRPARGEDLATVSDLGRGDFGSLPTARHRARAQNRLHTTPSPDNRTIDQSEESRLEGRIDARLAVATMGVP